MCPLFLLSLVSLLVVRATPCSARHVININSSTAIKLSSLVWDPTAQHFVVGSAVGPTVYSIPDEATVKCLLSVPYFDSSGGSVIALSVDQIRLRLIVAFSNPSYVAAYDLNSFQNIYALPLPELDGAPGGVVVDPESGEVVVSSAVRGIVLKVGLLGDSKRVISKFKTSDNQGLSGMVYLSHGYILVLQTKTGKIFKVDTVDGTVKEVLHKDSSMPLAPFGHAITLHSKRAIAVATNQSVLLIESDNNWAWARASAFEKKMKMKEGERAVAVAMQDRELKENPIYVLVNSQKGYRIEKVVWGMSWVTWTIIFLVGLCLCLINWAWWECFKDRDPFYTPYG